MNIFWTCKGSSLPYLFSTVSLIRRRQSSRNSWPEWNVHVISTRLRRMNPKQVNGVGGGVVQSFRFKRVKILREPHRRRGLGLVLPCIYAMHIWSKWIHKQVNSYMHIQSCHKSNVHTTIHLHSYILHSPWQGLGKILLNYHIHGGQSSLREIIPTAALRNNLLAARERPVYRSLSCICPEERKRKRNEKLPLLTRPPRFCKFCKYVHPSTIHRDVKEEDLPRNRMLSYHKSLQHAQNWRFELFFEVATRFLSWSTGEAIASSSRTYRDCWNLLNTFLKILQDWILNFVRFLTVGCPWGKAQVHYFLLSVKNKIRSY